MKTWAISSPEQLQAKYKLDVNEVVKKYDAFLQYGLITTSSFQNILDGEVNQRKRILQLTMILYFWIYVIPRYSFLSLLYFQDEQTRMHYQYILADYNEEMGMLGRTYNVAYIIFGIGTFVNDVVIRKFEGQGSLEFLTDWLKRVPKKTRIEDGDSDGITAKGDLDNDSKHKLISGLHYKLIFARFLAQSLANFLHLYDLIALLLFIYKRRPSLFITCLGLFNYVTIAIAMRITAYHHYSLYLSYVVTTDYFKLVIDNIIRKVEGLKAKGMTNGNVTPILNDYDEMMTDFKKYNRVLKLLLGNLVHFYMFALTVCFFMLTIKTEIWMLAIMIVDAAGFAFILLATGAYVSQLPAKVSELHNTLASLCSRHAGSKRQRLSLKCMFRLKHVIQELGSLETDGQFVIGLRDGEGAATSRMEIFDLTMETVSNVLMILGFVNGMDGMYEVT